MQMNEQLIFASLDYGIMQMNMHAIPKIFTNKIKSNLTRRQKLSLTSPRVALAATRAAASDRTATARGSYDTRPWSCRRRSSTPEARPETRMAGGKDLLARAAGRLPPSPRRCPPHLFVVPLGGLSRGARTVAQASMVSAARARLPVVGVRWLPARLPMVGAWRAAAAAWLPVGCPAARHLALSAWPPVVTPLRQLHLRFWCWKG